MSIEPRAEVGWLVCFLLFTTAMTTLSFGVRRTSSVKGQGYNEMLEVGGWLLELVKCEMGLSLAKVGCQRDSLRGCRSSAMSTSCSS